jgi:hypothetical protein
MKYKVLKAAARGLGLFGGGGDGGPVLVQVQGQMTSRRSATLGQECKIYIFLKKVKRCNPPRGKVAQQGESLKYNRIIGPVCNIFKKIETSFRKKNPSLRNLMRSGACTIKRFTTVT